MNIDQILPSDGQSAETGTQLPDLTGAVTDMLAPFMWLSVALTVLFVVFYVISMVRRRKLENALFDIQKNLRELNERDKARSQPASPPRAPGQERIIARTDSINNRL